MLSCLPIKQGTLLSENVQEDESWSVDRKEHRNAFLSSYQARDSTVRG
jgi:hypothetical protein